MIKPYKEKYPAAKNAIEFEWPDYKETYQPILALYFRDQNFESITTRTAYNKKTGLVDKSRYDELIEHINSGIPAIIHVEKHYMLVIGFDDKKKKLYINDPASGKTITVSEEKFLNRNDPWYKKRKGWDGRYLIAHPKKGS